MSVGARSSQSARSKMPGSRSSQRPCVSSTSSAPGAKTSKTKRAAGHEEPARGARAPRAAPSSVCRWRSARNGTRDERHALRPPAGRARSPSRRSTSLATPASAARVRADLEHPARRVDADHAARRPLAIGTAIRPVPTPSSTTGPPGFLRLVDVEVDVLGDAAGSTGRRARRWGRRRSRGLRATNTNSRLSSPNGSPLEAAVERLELEPGDVEQPLPLVLRRPPERDRPPVVVRDVDPVVGRRRSRIVCGTGSSWRLPSSIIAISWSNAKAFHAKRPPGFSAAATRSKVAPPVGPGREMQEGAKRAVDECCRLVERRTRSCRPRAGRGRRRPAPLASRWSSISGDASIPITRRPVSLATGTATRPVPTASSTIGPSASFASPT